MIPTQPETEHASVSHEKALRELSVSLRQTRNHVRAGVIWICLGVVSGPVISTVVYKLHNLRGAVQKLNEDLDGTGKNLGGTTQDLEQVNEHAMKVLDDAETAEQDSSTRE